MIPPILKNIFRSKPARAGTAATAIAALSTGVPGKILRVAYDKVTTRLVISKDSWYYQKLCDEIRKNSVSFMLTNNVVLPSSTYSFKEMKTEIGYGKSWSMLNGDIVMVERVKLADKQEEISLTYFLMTQETVLEKFNNLIETMKPAKPVVNKNPIIEILRATPRGDIEYVKADTARRRESVFTSENILDHIDKRLDEFVSRRKWYEDRGIPYKYAILFHGVPGTGKTTLAKYIAGKCNRQLVTLSPTELSMTTPYLSGRIALMEDIDCDMSTMARSDDLASGVGRGKKDAKGNQHTANLGDLLNAIDGINCASDCIIIATTNHIDKIDPALKRKGRFDDVIEVKPLGHNEIVRMVKFFFEDENLTGFMPKYPPITGAVVQDVILQNYENPALVIKQLNALGKKMLGKKESTKE